MTGSVGLIVMNISDRQILNVLVQMVGTMYEKIMETENIRIHYEDEDKSGAEFTVYPTRHPRFTYDKKTNE